MVSLGANATQVGENDLDLQAQLHSTAKAELAVTEGDKDYIYAYLSAAFTNFRVEMLSGAFLSDNLVERKRHAVIACRV